MALARDDTRRLIKGKRQTGFGQRRRSTVVDPSAPRTSCFTEQLTSARSWGPYGTGPVAIPFMWNATGRAAGSVFIGEKSAIDAATELHALVSKELEKNAK